MGLKIPIPKLTVGTSAAYHGISGPIGIDHLIRSAALLREVGHIGQDQGRVVFLGVALGLGTRDSWMWLRRPRCGEPEVRLSQAEVVALIAAYHQRKSIKELAQRYEVDRSAVGHP